ncbi:MAG: type I restriction-modification system subunit M N-terminal domain-containing protein [Desulfovibrio sp.]|jgi:type I restriction enzyme M protein|nr:type I restriction-modification system subunit M N-terminal domain-containing protein [Desulfovibrio sp.]
MHYNKMASTIWSVADLLRGSYKQSDYYRVILPFTLLRRIECILAPTREAVRAEHERISKSAPDIQPDIFLVKAAGYKFYNVTPLTLEGLKGDPANIRHNMVAYINGFSENCREIFTR